MFNVIHPKISLVKNVNKSIDKIEISKIKVRSNTINNSRNKTFGKSKHYRNPSLLKNYNDKIKKKLMNSYSNNDVKNLKKNLTLNTSQNINEVSLISENILLSNGAAINEKKIIRNNNNNCLMNSNKKSPLRINYKKNFNYNNTEKNEIKKNSEKKISECLIKLDKIIKDYKNLSKTKKYNLIKNLFEEFIKIFENNNNIHNFLNKILSIYHKIFLDFSNENRNLKINNNNLNEQNKKFDKKNIENNNIINQKNKEILLLKKQINVKNFKIEKNFNKVEKESVNNNKNINDKIYEKNFFDKQSEIDTEINKQIYKYNKNNINDLDAIYFFDKIKMKYFSNNDLVPFIKMNNKNNNNNNNINNNNFNNNNNIFINNYNNKIELKNNKSEIFNEKKLIPNQKNLTKFEKIKLEFEDL